MHELGQFTLLASLVFSVVGAATAVMGGRNDDQRLVLLSKRCLYSVWACLLVAAMLLWHFILSHDFSNEYVAHYSDTKMPWYYLLASFWGGQKGSMLFWTVQTANFSALAVFLNRDRNREILPYVIATMLSVLVFFEVVLIFATNPFERFLVLGSMPEGDGLNPLLQNPAMTFHPPTMLSAYAIWAVPFAFCVGALIKGRLNEVWIRSTRRWAIFGWFLLSMGNLFGALWAYEELGWGGYWAWDPVENAAFMPWLTATAYLHSIMIQERRGLLKLWNICLLLLTFFMTVFGTFITRTGLIQSVHSFATGGPLKSFFSVFLLLIMAVCVGLVVWRFKHLRSEGYIDSWLSREAAFVGNNVLLVTGMVVVLWGTMFPKLNEAISGREMSIGPPWFNQFMAPIGIVLLALTGIGPLISWRRSSWSNFQRNFSIPILWGAALTAVELFLFGQVDWFASADLQISMSPFRISGSVMAVVALYFCNFVLVAMLFEFWRGTAVRRRATGEPPLTALVNLVGKARRRYGGYLVHIGIVMLFFGFAGTAFQQERDVRMRIGEEAQVGDYRIRFMHLSEEDHPEKMVVMAHVDVHRGARHVGEMKPSRFLFRNQEKTNTTEVDIRSNLYEDFYLALVNIGTGGSEISLKVVVNPLIFWMWVGALMLMLGAVIAMMPAGVLEIRSGPRSARRLAAKTAGTAALLGALLLPWGVARVVHAAPEVSDVDSPEALDLFARVRCDCGGCGDVPVSMCQPTCARGGEIRREIVADLARGQTPEQIIGRVVQERGEMALAYPVEGGLNFLHWLVPAAASLLGLALGAVAVRRLMGPPATVLAEVPVEQPPNRDAELEPYRDRLDRELSRLD